MSRCGEFNIFISKNGGTSLKITIFSFFEKHSPTCENFTFAHIGTHPFMGKFHKELGESKKGHFRKGSKELGPMKLSIPIGQEF